MTRIVFLDRGTMGPVRQLRRPSFGHDWVEHERTRPAQVVERLRDCDIAISNKVPIRRDSIELLPRLKMIAIPATGHDAFDIDACAERGIVVSNVQGYAVNTVPEHTFALILALRRSLLGYRRDVIAGRWQEADQFCFFTHPIGDLAGSVLGIFGEGMIGQRVARLGEAFGMRALFGAHKGVSGLGPLYTPFREVLATSNVITLHCPLLPGTRRMLAMPEFRQMKKCPLIINCGRGGLVDEADLVRALDLGLIGGIGFDCLTSEPPQPDNPLLAVLDRPNVIVTPHVAWASMQAMETLWDQVVCHIENFQKGRPSGVVGSMPVSCVPQKPISER
ncbi:MAG TPA: D-2-hydroxyacid dehydrogenase [Xanthobacteraceae bacterium]|jgi:glycerate dehydrogenase